MASRWYLILAAMCIFISFEQHVSCSKNKNDVKVGANCIGLLHRTETKCRMKNKADMFMCLLKRLLILGRCLTINSGKEGNNMLPKENEKRSCAGDCWGRFYQCETLAGSTLDQLTCIRGREICTEICHN